MESVLSMCPLSNVTTTAGIRVFKANELATQTVTTFSQSVRGTDVLALTYRILKSGCRGRPRIFLILSVRHRRACNPLKLLVSHRLYSGSGAAPTIHGAFGS